MIYEVSIYLNTLLTRLTTSHFGMKPWNIKASDIEDFRVANNLTWHELNDVKTMQLVPLFINSKFGHLGGVGEINAGAYMPRGFFIK
ncbi:NAD+--asparagine ADP-ribosyltransferase [Sporosarcina psychrophila]|uniref:NAD+--asparagine ADP-ribosyltransferase n=1 Tax=Sporosarcina psychrophila TaxID=1476 RepID=A0ABV2K5G4_SPOPS